LPPQAAARPAGRAGVRFAPPNGADQSIVIRRDRIPAHRHAGL